MSETVNFDPSAGSVPSGFRAYTFTPFIAICVCTMACIEYVPYTGEATATLGWKFRATKHAPEVRVRVTCLIYGVDIMLTAMLPPSFQDGEKP